ncbi:MAG TPA: type II toxin-antitoxin system HicB family antitoxin [Thiotrichaceae bacterium]|nr:type II toxin-antitoxin system HicB family antitoxin [Thiotrichaceae bacterium]
MPDLSQYPFEIRPLSEEEGSGFLITFPDFSECLSDGETIEETIQNGLEALHETIAALESKGFPIPKPGTYGQPIQLPISLYRRLLKYAKQEGLGKQVVSSENV